MLEALQQPRQEERELWREIKRSCNRLSPRNDRFSIAAEALSSCFFCQFNTWLKAAGQLPFVCKETGRRHPQKKKSENQSIMSSSPPVSVCPQLCGSFSSSSFFLSFSFVSTLLPTSSLLCFSLIISCYSAPPTPNGHLFCPTFIFLITGQRRLSLIHVLSLLYPFQWKQKYFCSGFSVII